MTPDISKELVGQQIDSTTEQLPSSNAAQLKGEEVSSYGVTFEMASNSALVPAASDLRASAAQRRRLAKA